MSFYVYILFDWLGVPRYVGKGKGDRWLVHERKTDPINWMKNEFIERTWIMLGEVPKRKFEENLTDEEACRLERALIRLIGRQNRGKGPLTNLTDGGEGVSGLKHSEKTRALLSKQRAGIPNPEHSAKLKGRKLSAAHRSKISSGLSGHALSEVTKTKIGAANRGQRRTAETKINLSLAHRGKVATEETKAKMSAAHKKRWKNPKLRASVSARWKDPEFLEKVSQKLKGSRTYTPEYREKLRAAANKRWNKNRELGQLSFRGL
jgi:hypothetical protein